MNTDIVKEEHIEGEFPRKQVKVEDKSELHKGFQCTTNPIPFQAHPYYQMGTMFMIGQMMRMPFAMCNPYMARMQPMFNIQVDPNFFSKMQQAQRIYFLQAQKAMALKDMKKTPSNVSTDASPVKTEESSEINSAVKLSKKFKKKTVRVSACKNYIGLLCAGFSRAVLTSEKSSPILQFASELITQRKQRFVGLETQTIEQLVETFRTYVHQNICGKKVKKSNRERDFKVRNSEELDQLLIAQPYDTELTCLRKEILREMMNFFFTSDCYTDWLNKGMISESNRVFFLKNKKEIQKKFQNPAYYKPRFNHNQDETVSA